VDKLGVEAIGVEEGRREVPHGEQKAAAGGDRRHTLGSRRGVLGSQWRVVELHEVEGSLAVGVVVVREWLRRPIHGEQEAVADGDRRQPCSGQNWRAAGGWGARAEVGEAV
jgi:hypothetical protein